MTKTQVAAAINQFGIKVLQKLWGEKKGQETVFISPASISMALTMCLNGAAKSTRMQMAKALGLSPQKLDETNAAIKELVEEMESADKDAKLEIANALFSRLGYPFQQKFIDTNVANFRAEVKPLDFEGDPDGSLTTINGWCDEKTHGKIKSILDKINPEAVMYLLNAVYFKGIWSVKFDKKATKPREFTLLDGSKSKHPTMVRRGDGFQYFETADFQAVSLGYGEGRFVMDVYLPAEGKTIGDLVTALSAEEWESFSSSFEDAEGTLYLPKFKLEFEAKLNDVLKAVGLECAFDRLADFSNMVVPPERARIDEVRHKTFIEVNEEFTEAAAVTSVGMVRTTSIRPPKPQFEMDVNRPFLVAIRDGESGATLFLGAIVEPK